MDPAAPIVDKMVVQALSAQSCTCVPVTPGAGTQRSTGRLDVTVVPESGKSGRGGGTGAHAPPTR
jgi:hypothetical protein